MSASMKRLGLTLLLPPALLAGCLNLAPDYQRPAPPVPAQLPPGGDAAAADAWPAWNTLLRDERQRGLVQQALVNNRD